MRWRVGDSSLTGLGLAWRMLLLLGAVAWSWGALLLAWGLGEMGERLAWALTIGTLWP